MKRKITALYIAPPVGVIRYIVRQKENWWSCWHYIKDGQYPRLFTHEEILEQGLLKGATIID